MDDKKSGWDENGIYREYDENGNLILEQTYYGSISGNCEVGRNLLTGLANAFPLRQRDLRTPTAGVEAPERGGHHPA